MSEVEEFINQFEGEQVEIMLYFHNWLANELNLIDKIRFDIPFYYNLSWICYLNPTKNGNVEFAFVRGNELSNEQGLLESKGRKQVYSIEINSIENIPHDELHDIIHEAILLDQTKPYQSKRSKK
ncbi:MAG: DUF1801 domain-containing protein [Chlorobiota bacterium]